MIRNGPNPKFKNSCLANKRRRFRQRYSLKDTECWMDSIFNYFFGQDLQD
jgi:hypothetical protein